MDLNDDRLIEVIVSGLRGPGFVVLDQALPDSLASCLLEELESRQDQELKQAAVGREAEKTFAGSIRRDKILWIDGQTSAQQSWVDLMDRLRICLNQRLFLGLFSFESHFARYQPGDYYKKHLDAFKGQSNRVLSVVTYLNQAWSDELGGELVLYQPDGLTELCRVLPLHRRMVIFLSEEFPHEVLPSLASRQSIAGWFRINSSTQARIDPPA